ncbi:MAG: serine--tRNA ligase [Bacteroidetes bacterium]|nr:serine--tRNA ligase [Bacteroidota bacterium]
MVELNRLRQDPANCVAALNKRHIAADTFVQTVLKLDEERRKLQTQLDEKLASQNKLSKEIGVFFKNGQQQEAQIAKEKTLEIKEAIKNLEPALRETSEKLQEALYKIPNIPQKAVPDGTTADHNEVVRTSGKIPDLPKGSMPHWELASRYNIIDFELGNKITGAGFPLYKGKGARVQRALINYFLDKNTAVGYEEYQPPHLVNEASGYGTGQLPDKEGQMYVVTEDNLYLIPTAEVPITNIFRDVILSETDLPVKCTAYTPCFRREAGSYGAHVRGLNRLHQFDKVEIVRIEKPEDSDAALQQMIQHVSMILDELELPYRILRLCGGDLGFTSAITYDFEVYSAAQERWLEVSSVSNFETYQANRLKLRYKNKEGKIQLAHTLNGSALALPRILAALLENNQTPDGIQIPKALQPYAGFECIN